jgi:hypothetical protein
MTTMELNAMRCELAREILNIDSSEMLLKLQRYFRRLKKEQPQKVYAISEEKTMSIAEDEVPYRTKDEILAGVERSFDELKLYKDGKLEFRTLEEVLDELPD